MDNSRNMRTSVAVREAERGEVVGVFRAESFEEWGQVPGDLLDDRYVEVLLDSEDVQKLIARIPPVNVPRAVQEKIHFRLYHDLREKGILPDGFPVPCDPYFRVEDRLPSYRDGVVEGEFVTVRVRRANGRRENARFNLLKGGFDGETFALCWNVVRWAPLEPQEDQPPRIKVAGGQG